MSRLMLKESALSYPQEIVKKHSTFKMINRGAFRNECYVIFHMFPSSSDGKYVKQTLLTVVYIKQTFTEFNSCTLLVNVESRLSCCEIWLLFLSMKRLSPSLQKF